MRRYIKIAVGFILYLTEKLICDDFYIGLQNYSVHPAEVVILHNVFYAHYCSVSLFYGQNCLNAVNLFRHNHLLSEFYCVRKMGKKVCPETRALVRFYRDKSEMSYRQISAKCGVSKSTVCKLCNLKENRDSQGEKCDTRVGRPRALNERDEREN